MANLPQELLEAIVYELYDVPALKLCALAAPQLRQPSQRLLLHKLHLRHDNMLAVLVLFEESPLIVAYFTRLHICLSATLLRNQSTLQLVLNRLDAVNICVVQGWHPTWAMKNIEPGSLDPLWAFVRTHSSRELQLQSLAFVPRHLFSDLLGGTQSVHLDGVFVPRTEDVVPFPPVRSPTLRRLHIRRGCLPVLEMLAHTPLAAHVSAIQHLTLFVSGANYPDCLAIISRSAMTLQYLHFHSLNIQIRPASFPPLPVLRRVEFAFDNSSRIDGGHWLASALPSLLDPPSEQSPALEELCIIFEWTFSSIELDAILHQGTLEDLDSMLSAHPARPRISWAFPESCVGEFDRKIRSYMPMSSDSGRFLVRSWSSGVDDPLHG
ncbi:hypothetical protein C8F01DRAFT_1164636 [Mycena amicta]|nr:hypothetical protein C8F01DRAFT_1164636 [Mycena amicta]